MSYTYAVEKMADVWDEFEPLARMQYAEMVDRLAPMGREHAPFNPLKETYLSYNERGLLTLFTIRHDGVPVGYAMVYVMPDMHNQELVAREDTLYVHPDHRRGVGRNLVKKILEALRVSGVKRVEVEVTTDPRVAHAWRRMGFQDTSTRLSYYFEGN